MNQKSFLFLLFALIFCGQLSAQTKLSRIYSVKDGLASNTVYNILVDKKGFLWFATDAGVSRFDGTSFTNFSAKDGLTDNDVFYMFEDDEERIWFLCFNQQPCFYHRGRFYNAGNFKELGKIKNYNWHIFYNNLHEVWFAGWDNIYRFKDNKITDFPLPGSYKVRMITKIDSVIYVLKDSDFYAFNNKTNSFVICSGLNLKTSDLNNILDLGKGKFILTDHHDFSHSDIFTCTINPSKHNIDIKFRESFDKEISSYTYEPEKNILRITFTNNTILEKYLLADSLSTIDSFDQNTFISDYKLDIQGNKWISFLHGGVQMFPKTQSNIIAVPSAINNSSTYYSIIRMNENLIVGNNDNTLLFISNGKVNETQRDKFYSANNRIIDLKSDKHGILWLASDNDVIIYNPAKKEFSSLKIFSNIKDMKYDEANDEMLFASSMGSFGVNCSNNFLTHNINNTRTTSIAGNLTDTCWYATLNGLFIYANKRSIPDVSLNSILNSRITCLETDNKKRLWVGTSTNGIFVVQNNNVLFHFTSGDGLTSDIIKNIFIDQHDAAWVSTNLGVSFIRTEETAFYIKRYNDKNNLVDNNVNDILVVNDTVYVVSSTGISYFKSNDTSGNYHFPVYVTRLKTEGAEYFGEDSDINISSKHNSLSLYFTGLSFLSSGDMKYEYYINEINTQPLYTKNNSVTYSGLAPGKYNFYLSATDVFGNKSLYPAHIKFTILPEWYQLLWLRWLAALAVIPLAVIITLKYSSQLEKRKRLQSELNQTISRLELEAIHIQINPHFIFNCLNAIQNSIHNNNTEKAEYFINRFAKLMRKALMLSKETFISIDEEYNFINNYLEVEQLRHNNGFSFLIEIDGSLNKSAPLIPAFCLQPFIENAIVHGIKYLKNEKGLITLQILKKDRLEIRLTDNGIGIEASKKLKEKNLGNHHSKGIELMLARVASLNKIYSRNIEVKITDRGDPDGKDHGTSIVISLNLI
jgi:ligand-binding sensor domain-containing protein